MAKSQGPKAKTVSPVIIAPSMLSSDFSKLGSELKALLRAGCNWIHLDIMDNHFVPNLTFGPPIVAALRKVSAKAYFDAHLMVDDPASLIEPFAKAGVQNLTVHSEACGERLRQVLDDIRALGMQAGVSIKPKTPVSAIEPILEHIDLALVMTVEPGFGGQALIPSCLSKIRNLNGIRKKRGLKFKIQADGGINEETAHLVSAAGCDVLVAGSAVFKGGDLAGNIDRLLRGAAA